MPTSATGDRGFTLVELLVALALFALAALALIRLQGAGVAGVHRLEARMLGQVVARNIAYGALLSRAPPPLGRIEGQERNGGRDWRWQRIVARAAEPGMIRVEVRVTSADGQDAGRLVIFRAGG